MLAGRREALVVTGERDPPPGYWAQLTAPAGHRPGHVSHTETEGGVISTCFHKTKQNLISLLKAIFLT